MNPGPDIALLPASDVAIIGFPDGMSASGITALWKSGAIASEPELKVDDEDFFWLDANTRKGMSGSPVIARRFGGALMEGGSFGVHGGAVDRTLGVYAGRAFEAPDMTLGRVWKWEGVQEIIEAAVAKCRRGSLQPYPCLLGHHYQPEKTMVQINILESVQVYLPTPSGGIEIKPFNVAGFIRDFILNDNRFGLNLERVKMGAKIAAALDASVSSGTPLELQDAEYAIVREAIEAPSNPYNPIVARQILPLLQHILDAGKDKTSTTP
jgi:hypothetical protein